MFLISTIKPSYLVGERVFLREMLIEDAPDVVRWRNNPGIKKWMISQDTLTVDSHMKWFDSRTEGRVDFMICDIKTRKSIGTVNYRIIESGVAESGRILGEKEYHAKGYASEAARIWLKYGFNYLHFEKILAKTKSDNIPNINLNIRLGFTKISEQIQETTQGAIRMVVMELKRDEYENSNS